MIDDESFERLALELPADAAGRPTDLRASGVRAFYARGSSAWSLPCVDGVPVAARGTVRLLRLPDGLWARVDVTVPEHTVTSRIPGERRPAGERRLRATARVRLRAPAQRGVAFDSTIAARTTRLVLHADSGARTVGTGELALGGLRASISDSTGVRVATLTAARATYDSARRVLDLRGAVVYRTTAGATLRTDSARLSLEAAELGGGSFTLGQGAASLEGEGFRADLALGGFRTLRPVIDRRTFTLPPQ